MSSIPSQPQQGQTSQTNVVVLKPRNNGRFFHTIYQEDLEELILLSRYFSEARENWEKKKEEIRAALASGARIEPGIHTAELIRVTGANYAVQKKNSYRLQVR